MGVPLIDSAGPRLASLSLLFGVLKLNHPVVRFGSLLSYFFSLHSSFYASDIRKLHYFRQMRKCGSGHTT